MPYRSPHDVRGRILDLLAAGAVSLSAELRVTEVGFMNRLSMLYRLFANGWGVGDLLGGVGIHQKVRRGLP